MSGLAEFEGAMVGLAVGDALGFPTEFRSRAAILEAFGPAGVTDFVALHDPRWGPKPFIVGPRHPAGTYSDDTQMSLAVAEALLDAGAPDLEPVMEAMARRFVAWSRSEDNDRAPGSTCMAGCRSLGAGTAWRDSGVPDSKGAGAPMRAVPIGLRLWRDRDAMLALARASSVPTHGHDAAVEGAAAVALMTAMALEKQSPRAIYDAIMAECAPRSSDLRACLARLPDLLDGDPAHVLSAAGLGEAWVAEEAVACALWCFWRSPSDFRRTVLTAANTDGDSDTIACIAGGVSGAFNGIEAIPQEWRDRVENSRALLALAGRLHDATAR